jgi:hypothetical protein
MKIRLPGCGSVSLVNSYQHFGGTFCFSLQERRANPEDGGSRFLRNVGNYLLDYKRHIPEDDNLNRLMRR